MGQQQEDSQGRRKKDNSSNQRYSPGLLRSRSLPSRNKDRGNRCKRYGSLGGKKVKHDRISLLCPCDSDDMGGGGQPVRVGTGEIRRDKISLRNCYRAGERVERGRRGGITQIR
ncbi:hypothetical protein NQZ68_041986 [Dissostichus eleginoides]|nr:hypothetical protein NQZ68_041986 [Dissostichus eleginoides]